MVRAIKHGIANQREATEIKERVMKICAIQLKETSQPIEHNFINTYEKGGFYCVYTEDEIVYKYPTQNIFRVVENYGAHAMSDDYDDTLVNSKTTDAFESEVGDPNVESVTILPKNRRMTDPAGILRQD